MDLRSRIAQDIVRRDPAFAGIVSHAGLPPGRRPAPVAQRFPSLIRSITFQLLATAAADTIHARVVSACGGEVSIESVLGAGPQVLRDAGLSRTKAAAMMDLAAHARDERIRLSRHGRMSDAEIIAEVTAVHGVGPWTTQMYLMHTLGRRDVWPVGDLGVRSGWSIVHGLESTIDEKELRLRGDALIGVRSDVAWYCWQAVHLERSGR
ncbi:MAG: DNA-3-methyladenine glycosylase 2 family protein [Acidobacteriota bacterium]|nr:DNA-3-methyladenine glycosylase 2 family protein [Acidobacteriota bacterium]MDE3031716.1 DNA-3-methyladenine glycosylase 2 family protein [Acidobacteriota bacterium]MDE3094071.1 DNA-3-methyladenine glycosylase 2 family protein [Acidobacteriota bacterium]MDE3146807.1 DNA-3-methyladenine glycosylase 2 family protein [Acidobacteriota bacterium]